MDTLKKAFLVLVMACAFVTFVMHFDANAAPYKKNFVTKRSSKVYPDLRTVERFIDVAAHRPNKINRFMRRNHVTEIPKGTRVVRVGSAMVAGTDKVVYKVRIPSQGRHGYIFSRNLKKMKKAQKTTVVKTVVYKEKHHKHKHNHKHKHKDVCVYKHVHNDNCTVKYVEKHVERHVETYSAPRHDKDHTVRFKAVLGSPVFVIDL